MKISEMSIEQLREYFAELSRDQLLLSLQTREYFSELSRDQLLLSLQTREAQIAMKGFVKMDKPIVTVSVPNDRARFEIECAYWFANGYVLMSSSCVTHSYGGAIDEMWLAVFALPSISS